MSDVTRLLAAIEQGDSEATAQLLPCGARRSCGVRPELTTSPRNGAIIPLRKRRPWSTRRTCGSSATPGAPGRPRPLFRRRRRGDAAASLIDTLARRGQARGGLARVDIDDAPPPIASPCENLDDLLALDEGVDRFAELDAAKAELVKLLYFAGLNLEEARGHPGRIGHHRLCAPLTSGRCLATRRDRDVRRGRLAPPLPAKGEGLGERSNSPRR